MGDRVWKKMELVEGCRRSEKLAQDVFVTSINKAVDDVFWDSVVAKNKAKTNKVRLSNKTDGWINAESLVLGADKN